MQCCIDSYERDAEIQRPRGREVPDHRQWMRGERERSFPERDRLRDKERHTERGRWKKRRASVPVRSCSLAFSSKGMDDGA